MQQTDKTNRSRQNTGNTNYATPKLKLIKQHNDIHPIGQSWRSHSRLRLQIYHQNSSVCTIVLAYGTELANRPKLFCLILSRLHALHDFMFTATFLAILQNSSPCFIRRGIPWGKCMWYVKQ